MCRWLACNHAFAWGLVAVQRYATDSCLGFFLDAFLGFRSAVPVRQDKAALFNLFLKLIISVDGVSEVGTVLESLLEDVVLYVVKQILNIFLDAQGEQARP